MFQRVGAISNAHVGRDFEQMAFLHFKNQNILLETNFVLPIGVGEYKKKHRFDFGSESSRIIVECKSHRWTAGNKVPSAKMTVWNEAMYYFSLVPQDFRKIFFVIRDVCNKRNISLAAYYYRTYKHLVPKAVEIVEYDSQTDKILWINSPA